MYRCLAKRLLICKFVILNFLLALLTFVTGGFWLFTWIVQCSGTVSLALYSYARFFSPVLKEIGKCGSPDTASFIAAGGILLLSSLFAVLTTR